ncbi:hypothetical protein IAT38_004224 [Cryptococcus sp. DSM 104549]
MFAKVFFVLATAAAAVSASAIKPRDESHTVNLINNCGSGNAVFLYENGGEQGSTTVNGQLNGGVAYVTGTDANCQSSGVNCGIVEFTLKNDAGGGEQNSADYSLETGPGLGNHQFTYKMDFAFTGACTDSPGTCTGNSASECPGAFLGSETEGGAPTQCLADNVGITITFC